MTAEDLWQKYCHLYGKKVTDSTGWYWGGFWGITIAPFDTSEPELYELYYLIKQDNGEFTFLSAVTGLAEFEESLK